MTTIKQIHFTKGVVASDGLPRDTKPYIGFLGRSNVGKSSTLNMLANNKKLARKSARPGKTTEINMFLVNGDVYFADLPGYGYAKQPDELRDRIEEMIAWYVGDTYIEHRRLVLIVDSRIGMTELDRGMLELLLSHHTPDRILILANKIDSLSQSEQAGKLRDIQAMAPGILVVPISARTGQGKKEATAAILAPHPGTQRR